MPKGNYWESAKKSERKGKVNCDYFLEKSWTTTNLRIAVSKRSTRRMLTVKANTKTFKNKQDKNNWNKKQHLDKLAANVSDLFGLLVDRQRAVAVDVE